MSKYEIEWDESVYPKQVRKILRDKNLNTHLLERLRLMLNNINQFQTQIEDICSRVFQVGPNTYDIKNDEQFPLWQILDFTTTTDNKVVVSVDNVEGN